MRMVILFGLWLTGAWWLQAQGLSQNFTCNIQGFELANGAYVPVSGSGSLFLRGTTLSYTIYVNDIQSLPVETHFHADRTDLRVSLAPFTYRPATATLPDTIIFQGSVQVTAELDSLLTGHWYVQMHSPDYLNAVIRGYVTPVPEPGVAVFATLGAAVLLGARRRVRRT